MSNAAFGKNLFFLVLVNVLIKPLYILGIEVQAQNMLGPNTWGVYAGLLNLCLLFHILLDPGIHNQNTKWISENRDNFSDRVGQTILLKFLLGLAFLLFLAFISLLLNYPSDYYLWLGIIAINFFFASLFVFVKSHFPALGKYNYETFFSVLDKLLLIIVLGVQIYGLKQLSLLNFLLSITAVNVFAFSVAFFFLRRIKVFRLKLDFRSYGQLLKSSIPFALAGLFMSFYNRIDAVMLERMLPDDGYAGGVYAAGYRLLDASNMFALLFASLLLPMFAFRLSEKKEIQSLLGMATNLMLIVVVMVVTAGYFYAYDIMEFLYTDYNERYGDSFRILILSFIGVGFSYIFGTLIAASGKLKHLNILLFIGICLNFGLNFWWIPIETSIGAAKATLITQSVILLGQILLVFNQFELEVHIKKWFKPGVFVLLSFVTVYLVSFLSIHWIWRILISEIILIIASFLLGLVRLSTLLSTK